MKKKKVPTRNAILIFALLVSLSGCGTLSNGHLWGQDATMTPGWTKIRDAAWNAAASPATWAPAAGALAFQIGHSDQKVSDWASSRTPVYGSKENADRMSDYLLETAGATWVATGIATPGGEDTGEWVASKAAGFTVQAGAGGAALGTVEVLKLGIHRTRPDGSDAESFPSAHGAGAALFATLASRNIETLSWSDTEQTEANIALGALTTATAWARVEAAKHYPSDVLAGIAIGHFFGAFITDAFLGLDNPHQAAFLVEPSREGTLAMIRLNF